MEMSEALVKLGMDVTIVERQSEILGSMDKDITEIVENELTRNRVTLLKSTSVLEFTGKNNRIDKVFFENGMSENTDLAVLGVGIKPNTEMASAAGVTLGKTGAIKVSPRMETNIPDIYAAGDCAEAEHLVLGRPVYIPLGTTANKQGKIAGINMAGEMKRLAVSSELRLFKCFDMEVARTGLSCLDACKEGIKAVCSTIEHHTRAAYYPGTEKIRVRLVADRDTGRLLGAQMVVAKVCRNASI